MLHSFLGLKSAPGHAWGIGAPIKAQICISQGWGVYLSPKSPGQGDKSFTFYRTCCYIT